MYKTRTLHTANSKSEKPTLRVLYIDIENRFAHTFRKILYATRAQWCFSHSPFFWHTTRVEITYFRHLLRNVLFFNGGRETRFFVLLLHAWSTYSFFILVGLEKASFAHSGMKNWISCHSIEIIVLYYNKTFHFHPIVPSVHRPATTTNSPTAPETIIAFRSADDDPVTANKFEFGWRTQVQR